MIEVSRYICILCERSYPCILTIHGPHDPPDQCIIKDGDTPGWKKIVKPLQCPECGSESYSFTCGDCEYSEVQRG